MSKKTGGRKAVLTVRDLRDLARLAEARSHEYASVRGPGSNPGSRETYYRRLAIRAKVAAELRASRTRRRR